MQKTRLRGWVQDYGYLSTVFTLSAPPFKQYRKSVTFYSDRHGIFRVNVPSRGSGEALTQFGRAMQELDIQIICANSPQAKGWVERVIQTLQDRLPKEMRLRGIANMLQGNAYLPEFLTDFNQRFAVEPRSTLQFHKTVYKIQTDRPTYALRNAQVTLCVNAQEQIRILYHHKALPYSIYNQQAKQAEIVSTKQLD
jgi:hypothetical protein